MESLPDPSAAAWLAMAIAATAAAWLGSVVGTGGTLILLPVLVLVLGAKDALPVLTLCNITANASRAWIHRREIDLELVRWFLLLGVPGALAGAYLFTLVAPEVLLRALGVLLILLVLWRHGRALWGRRPWRIRRASTFAPLGGGFGFMYGFVEGVGPLMAPFFLAYGLVRASYIGTDAMVTMVMQGTKLATFGQLDVLSLRIVLLGVSLAPLMILGSWLGKRTLDRIPPQWFVYLVEGTVVIAGMSFIMR